MQLRSFKRFHMEIDLRGRNFEIPPLAPEFRACAWNPSLLDAHATAHYLSFRHHPDAKIFESFQTYKGCRQVMEHVFGKAGFVPDATWLIIHLPPGAVQPTYCAGIQGTIDAQGLGAIQNVGVIPEFRHRGLGRQCVLRALEGFRKAGVPRVHLEVTASNETALGLYRNIGFVPVKVVYKPGR